MKRIIAAFSIALVLCLCMCVYRDISGIEDLTDKIIRLHVIADSNSDYAQKIKLNVRDEALACVSQLTCDCSSKSQAQNIIINNLDGIKEASQKVLRENGCNAAVEVSYEKVLVDRREYDGFTLPQGIYSALCIRIGEAKGKNWWCVLYPSLCTSCAADIEELGEFSDDELVIIKNPEKVKYRLALFELFERLLSKINSLDFLRQ